MDKQKASDLVFRADMLNSLAWLGMDVMWMFYSSRVAIAFAVVTVITAGVSLIHLDTKTDRYLYASCFFWILMDCTWLLSEFFPAIETGHIPAIMAGFSAVLLILTLAYSIKIRWDKGSGMDYCGMCNTMAWFAMDATWLVGLHPLTLVFGILTCISGLVVIHRSENKAVWFVNGSMFLWSSLNVSELLTDHANFDAITSYTNPISITLVLVFLLCGMVASHNNPRILAVFRRVRLSAHAKVVCTTSVLPQSTHGYAAG